MVSTFIIVSLALTALIAFATVLLGSIKLRKEPNFIMNILVGFIIYFMSQSALSVVLSIVNIQVPALVYFALVGLTFTVVSTLVILGLKKFAMVQTLSYRSITFGSMVLLIFQTLFSYLSLFMASFAVNKNDLAGAYPTMGAEEITNLTNMLTNMTVFEITYTLSFVALTIVSYGYSFKRIVAYANGNGKVATLVEVALIMIFVNIIPELIAILFGNSAILLTLVFILISTGLIFLDKKRA